MVRSLVTLVLACLLLAGCPKPKRHTLVPSLPTSGDASARKRFVEARDRFLRDGSGQDDFVEIARDFPDDPIAPFANLYAGIAAVQGGDAAAAIAPLQAVVAEAADPGLVARAELFLGLAWNATGEPARAVPLLARGEPAIENDAERGDWIAATAAATAATAPLEALPWLDRYWDLAADAERGWILATLEALVDAASPDDALAAWRGLARGDGPSAAVLGARVAADLAATDPDGAAAIRARIAAARERLGLASLDGRPALVDVAIPGVIGAVLPLDGNQSRVAEAAARGLAIAAGAHGGAAAVTVEVADAAGAKASAAAVDQLAAAGVIAIVGPIDGDSVDAAAARAEELGVPLLSLNPRADQRPDAGGHVFHVMHSAEARARILVRRARAAGLTRFAVLAPDSGYGTAVTEAFVDEVDDQGGTITTTLTYANDTASFAKHAKKLAKDKQAQAVFIPDQADRVELIAPALAAAGMVARPPGGKVGKKQGRAIVLLSTVEGLNADYVRDAGRHSIGALLAPGFYPDRSDPTIGAFVDRYQQAHDKLPTAVDAYAHDAALAIAVAAGREASRAAVARNLEIVDVAGATGSVRFGKDHRRADDGVVFTIDADGEAVTVAP